MKANLNSRASKTCKSGSAMLISLMVMAVATMGVAGWVTIVNARTNYTESMEDGMRRRVAIENSREIAEEFMYQVAATQNGVAAASYPADPDANPDPNPPFNASQPDIVEQVLIAASAAGPLNENSTAPIGRVNRLGMAEGVDCFQVSSNVQLGKGGSREIRRFELRSRSPILYGDLVTLHRPTITPGSSSTPDIRFSGNVNVRGRTVLWRPDMIYYDNTSLFTSDQYVLMSDDVGDYPIYNSGGGRVRPSNFPATPISAGSTPGGSLGFDGQLSTVQNTSNSLNSMHARLGASPIEANGLVASSERGVVSNGVGSISINLSDAALSKVLIDNDTRTITLNGQANDTDFDAAGGMQPVLIVILQDGTTDRDLDTIELTHRNNRRLIVAVKKTIDVGQSASRLRAEFVWMNSNTNPKPTWRLIAIGENTEILFGHVASSSHVTIYGGVRTDRGFYSDNGDTETFTIERETDPGALATLLDRNVWLESYNPD